MIRIGVPREIKAGENRVGMTPAGVAAARAAGADVVVESLCGAESGFPDPEYAAAGAVIAAGPDGAWDADLVVKVKEPLPPEYRHLDSRRTVFTYLHLAAVPELADALLSARVTAIAYETVRDGHGLPLLRPMSEVAGALSIQSGARGLEKTCGGRGVLLAGIDAAPPGKVCILGAGNAGRMAARVAAGMGADVVVLDVLPDRLDAARASLGDRVRTEHSAPASIEREVTSADLVVSTILVVGDRTPVLLPRELLRRMKRGAVLVDVAVDQGGTAETSRPTTHAAPFYEEEGVIHYCVANMPAAVPRTSTIALTGATLPYVLRMAERGIVGALREDPVLRSGLNTFAGRVVSPGVARALARPFADPEALLG